MHISNLFQVHTHSHNIRKEMSSKHVYYWLAFCNRQMLNRFWLQVRVYRRSCKGNNAWVWVSSVVLRRRKKAIWARLYCVTDNAYARSCKARLLVTYFTEIKEHPFFMGERKRRGGYRYKVHCVPRIAVELQQPGVFRTSGWTFGIRLSS